MTSAFVTYFLFPTFNSDSLLSNKNIRPKLYCSLFTQLGKNETFKVHFFVAYFLFFIYYFSFRKPNAFECCFSYQSLPKPKQCKFSDTWTFSDNNLSKLTKYNKEGGNKVIYTVLEISPISLVFRLNHLKSWTI